MGCGSSKATVVEFKNGAPKLKGNEVVKCFNEGNGLLFRIVDSKTGRWGYYNDTVDYEMRVSVTFGEGSSLKALGKTKIERLASGEQVATVVVMPRETELFVEGHVNGYKAKMDALPLSDEERRRLNSTK
ncbi:putative calpain like protein [Trypanosoma vivax]|uniref:Putative calpain-like protein n=1 Tax=Trypanosoma vivax (strain Y486) TaxID=1055687 RepID=G0TR95_TRYVY|nr:putative calpain like protein [Trypanosoma vivax]CCC46459.1 putative calpain-like protein fragment, fragment [Trypanosoma vivax Y486]